MYHFGLHFLNTRVDDGMMQTACSTRTCGGSYRCASGHDLKAVKLPKLLNDGNQPGYANLTTRYAQWTDR